MGSHASAKQTTKKRIARIIAGHFRALLLRDDDSKHEDMRHKTSCPRTHTHAARFNTKRERQTFHHATQHKFAARPSTHPLGSLLWFLLILLREMRLAKLHVSSLCDDRSSRSGQEPHVVIGRAAAESFHTLEDLTQRPDPRHRSTFRGKCRAIHEHMFSPDQVPNFTANHQSGMRVLAWCTIPTWRAKSVCVV